MKLSSLYIISGDETLLVNEALAAIEKNAFSSGFIEKQRFDNDTKETWEQFSLIAHSRSLFAEKTLLLCRFASQKISEPAQKCLQKFAENIPSDKMLVIIFPKLTPTQLNSAWLQALKKVGTFSQLWPVNAKQFPTWLKQRLHLTGFQLNQSALQLLIDHTEGNLLAASQCIQKLRLLYDQGSLTESQVLDCLSPSAHYTVFDLVNAIFQKQLGKMQNILETLQAEGTEPLIVLWAIARECRTRHQLNLIPELNEIDQMIKGIKSGSAWRALQRVCFAMAGKPLFKPTNRS